MARLPRLYAPSVVQYVIQRPIEGRTLFVDADDYALFVTLLDEAARTHALAVHAYVLLPREIRLLATPSGTESIARCMQAIGRRYVPSLNRKAGRTGPLWDRRYRSTLIDADTYLFAAMRHIEQGPVARGLATAAAGWRRASRAHHVGSAQQPLINDHVRYWALSDTPFERQRAYRALVDELLPGEIAARIEQAVERGWALGDDAFVRSLQSVANRRTAPLGRGRKPKTVQSQGDVSPIKRGSATRSG